MDPHRLKQENQFLRETVKSLGQFSKDLLVRIETQDVQMLALKDLLDQIITGMRV
jgi:hypothetical protein